jgi:hypothetical protein
MEKAICERCGSAYVRRKPWQKYCNRNCEHRAWVLAHPEQAKALNARSYRTTGEHLRRYGVTKRDWEGLLSKQDGRCAICGCELKPGYSTHTDHVVIDGRPIIRGILCRGCNMGLGMFGENPATLERAAEYLRSASGAV